MASTYANILLHFIFAPGGRENCLRDDFREQLHRYIHGIINNTKSKQIAIGSIEDHVHLLISLHPSDAPAKVIQLVKGNSSKWINEQGFVKRRFEWQEGYGVFSHPHSNLEKVRYYIEHQRDHHATIPFQVEFIGILKMAGIGYKEEYLFQWMDDEAGAEVSSLRDFDSFGDPSIR